MFAVCFCCAGIYVLYGAMAAQHRTDRMALLPGFKPGREEYNPALKPEGGAAGGVGAPAGADDGLQMANLPRV